MELSKKDTKMIQGFSVIAMVCLHLFCRYEYGGGISTTDFYRRNPTFVLYSTII